MNADAKLDLWIKNGLNVLFVGKHGTGKTSMVKEAFTKNNLKWKYYSASTMDPWVDFIGCPKETTENINGKDVSCLKLIKPREWASGEVEAVFFDEYNRAPKKVRNAVMELIQFKSINGEKFPNLKIIWAAINPNDDEQNNYDVEALDPAQEDRFHIKVNIAYEPNGDYFRSKYGEKEAKVALEWWKELTDDIKNLVSPRRLEYALMLRAMNLDIRDALPKESNANKLINALKNGSMKERLETLYLEKNVTEGKTFMYNENNFSSALTYIKADENLRKFFIPLMPPEKIAALMHSDEDLRNHILENSDDIPEYKSVVKEVLDAGTNKRLSQLLRLNLTENPDFAEKLAS